MCNYVFSKLRKLYYFLLFRIFSSRLNKYLILRGPLKFLTKIILTAKYLLDPFKSVSVKILFIFALGALLNHESISNYIFGSGCSSNSTYSVAIAGFATSLMAASFIDIFRKVRENNTAIYKGFNIKRLFKVTFEYKKTAILLSKFPLSINNKKCKGYEDDRYRVVHEEEYGIVNINTDTQFMTLEEKNKYYSTVVYQDLIACANIKSIFEVNGAPSPIIRTDKEIIKDLVNSSHRFNVKNNLGYKTYICVGLFSNEVTMWINKYLKPDGAGRFFRLFLDKDDTNDDKTGLIHIASYKGKKIEVNEDNWKDGNRYISKQKVNHEKKIINSYGLFARVYHQGICFIIIGGLNALATKGMGNYVKKNWEKILQFKDAVTKESIKDDNPFAIVFTIEDGKVLDENHSREIRISKGNNDY